MPISLVEEKIYFFVFTLEQSSVSVIHRYVGDSKDTDIERYITALLFLRRNGYHHELHRCIKSKKFLTQRQAYVRDEERVLKATAVRTVKVVGYGVTKQPKSLKFDADTYDMLRERNHSNAIITRYGTDVVLLLRSNHLVKL